MPGKRDGDACERLIRQVQARTTGRTDVLITSDEHASYETAIRTGGPKLGGWGLTPSAR